MIPKWFIILAANLLFSIDYYGKNKSVVLHSGSREYYHDISMILEPNEHITEITCESDNIGVISLTFSTNKGKAMNAKGEVKSKYSNFVTKNFGEHNHALCGFKTVCNDRLLSLSCYTQNISQLPKVSTELPKRPKKIMTKSSSYPNEKHYKFSDKLSTINECESPIDGVLPTYY